MDTAKTQALSSFESSLGGEGKLTFLLYVVRRSVMAAHERFSFSGLLQAGVQVVHCTKAT